MRAWGARLALGVTHAPLHALHREAAKRDIRAIHNHGEMRLAALLARIGPEREGWRARGAAARGRRDGAPGRWSRAGEATATSVAGDAARKAGSDTGGPLSRWRDHAECGLRGGAWTAAGGRSGKQALL